MELFTKHYLPTKPLATNDYRGGVRRVKKEKVLSGAFSHVETSPKTYRNMVFFDVDHEEAEWDLKTKAFDEESIPVPNMVTLNPATGHAHAGYILASPVGSLKGLNWLRDIESSLQPLLGADRAYSGRMTRSPLTHPSFSLTDHLYTLAELAAFIPKEAKSYTTVSDEDEINGRNDFLFHSLRRYAYGAFRRNGWNGSLLEAELTVRALELNHSSFEGDLLPDSELNSTVKSVTKWVVKNHSEEAFSKIQSARAKKLWSSEAVVSARQERINRMLSLQAEGKSSAEIGKLLGVGASTVRMALRKHRNDALKASK